MASLGLYRFFYILSWIYRYFVEDHFSWTSVLGGILQTGIYADFLWIYYKRYSFIIKCLVWNPDKKTSNFQFEQNLFCLNRVSITINLFSLFLWRAENHQKIIFLLLLPRFTSYSPKYQHLNIFVETIPTYCS